LRRVNPNHGNEDNVWKVHFAGRKQGKKLPWVLWVPWNETSWPLKYKKAKHCVHQKYPTGQPTSPGHQGPAFGKVQKNRKRENKRELGGRIGKTKSPREIAKKFGQGKKEGHPHLGSPKGTAKPYPFKEEKDPH